jgi:8-oxo-dGTP pyrophosphatase MutT (NUDIX family)
VADYRVFSVERSRASSPVDASLHDFYRIRSTSWTQIVPVTDDRRVVMVRQYRHGVGRVTLEIPGGLVDAGEDPREAAMRECLEETGYRARDAVSLGILSPNPALFANSLYGYLATGVVREGAVKNEGTEQTEVLLVPVSEIAAMIIRGEIDHALVVATLWRYLYQHPPP